MIVYMLFNHVTDLAYIGKTIGGLKERWHAHVEDACIRGSILPLHRAIRECGVDVWSQSVLEHCSSEKELAEAEGNWIEYCGTLDPHVGYNVARAPCALDKTLQWYAREKLKQSYTHEDFVKWGRRGAKTKDQMSPEEIEQYREWGRKGTKRKTEMTPEERQRYVEWGRKGARISKERCKKL